LIHECMACKTLSINRIAADDDSETVMTIFHESLLFGQELQCVCRLAGIVILNAEDTKIVYRQLYGRAMEIPAISWS
jgi:hypothetical protein